MGTFCLPWQHHLFDWGFVNESLQGLVSNPQPCLSSCCSVPEEQLHNIDEYDLNVVRLCFQAFLPDEHGNYTLALPPLISNPIYDNSKYQPGRTWVYLPLLLLFSFTWDGKRQASF